MAVARIVWWSFKPGTRAEAVKKIDGMMDEIKSNTGYQGFLMLLSKDNPDRVTVVSIWENDAAMSHAEKEQFPRVIEVVSDLLTKQPQVAHQDLHTLDIPKIYA